MTMDRVQSVAGLLTGLFIVLCSLLHTLGWRSLERKLDAAQVPRNLQFEVAVIWHFGGAAILVFGLIMATLFCMRLRGRSVTMAPVVLVAAFYVTFGSYAVSVKSASPFLFVFLIPGVVSLLAATRVSHRQSEYPASGKTVVSRNA
jgi:hypothetical protein